MYFDFSRIKYLKKKRIPTSCSKEPYLPIVGSRIDIGENGKEKKEGYERASLGYKRGCWFLMVPTLV